MPFRNRLKRALGGGSSSSSDSNKTSSKTTDKTNLPDNVYKPGEVMPRPKYRGPWNQEHQDKLARFNFGGMGRRPSGGMTRTGSDYSPMGSKLPSRGPSRGPSRTTSSMSWGSFGSKRRERDRIMLSPRASMPPDPMRVDENTTGDDDVSNVGLSRQQTAEEHQKCRNIDEDAEMDRLEAQKTVTNTHDLDGATEKMDTQRTITGDDMFTEEDLAKAMTQSTLKSSRRDRS